MGILSRILALRAGRQASAQRPEPAAPAAQASASPPPGACAAAPAEHAAAIVELCTEAGIAEKAAELLASGATLEQARAVVDWAMDVRRMVSAAHRVNPAISESLAADFIAAGASVEHVRAELLEMAVSLQSPEINNHQPPEERRRASQEWSDTMAPDRAEAAALWAKIRAQQKAPGND